MPDRVSGTAADEVLGSDRSASSPTTRRIEAEGLLRHLAGARGAVVSDW